MLDQEMQGVRAVLTRLETAQAQHSEALRTATALWAEQIGYLRARTQGLGETNESQRSDLQRRIEELHAEVARLNGLATQAQVQERTISQLEREQGRTSLAVTQLAEAHTDLLERVERRFDRVQGRIDETSRSINWLIAIIVLICLTVGYLAFLVGTRP